MLRRFGSRRVRRRGPYAIESVWRESKLRHELPVRLASQKQAVARQTLSGTGSVVTKQHADEALFTGGSLRVTLRLAYH